MRFVLVWLLLAGFWLGLSGYLDAAHLTFGVVSVTLVTLLTWRLLAPEPRLGPGLGRLLRLALYAPWLLYQIVVANVDVLLRVLGLKPVAPTLVRLKPGLETDFGRVAFANSITLTPGTVTIEIRDDEFIVHAIAPAAADALREGTMARRVRQVEGQAS